MFSIVLRNQTQGFMATRQALLPTKLHSQPSISNYKTTVNFLQRIHFINFKKSLILVSHGGTLKPSTGNQWSSVNFHPARSTNQNT